MAKTSVLIPSRNEQYLSHTVEDVLAHATGEIEVITVWDGYVPDPPLPRDARVRVIHHPTPRGMRPSINEAASVATGDFLLKCDAHCSFALGFDKALQACCEPGAVVVPARYELNPVTWTVVPGPPIEAHYLSWPFAEFNTPGKLPQWHGRPWWARMADRKHVPIDDDMTMQGSCWLMRHQDFLPLQVEGYGSFVQEPEQLCLGAWLSGGRTIVNKQTSYAHYRKRDGQGYVRSKRESLDGMRYSIRHWLFDQTDQFAVYLARFWPVPGWPTDWRDQVEQRREQWHA